MKDLYSKLKSILEKLAESAGTAFESARAKLKKALNDFIENIEMLPVKPLLKAIFLWIVPTFASMLSLYNQLLSPLL